MDIRKMQQTHGFGIVPHHAKMWTMLETRLKDLKKLLLKEKLDAVFVSNVSNIIYLTGYTNFSKEEREAYLLIGKSFEYLITDARYSEAIKKEVPHFVLYERGYENRTEDLFKKLSSKIKNIGVEEDNLTVSEYKFIKKYFKKIKNFDIERTIKNKNEIDKIQHACKIGDLAFAGILKKIKTGVTEKQIALEIEKFIKNQQAETSFKSIVAFDKNSSIPHHQTGSTKLGKKSGQFILLDFGVKYENYCSDMTRTIFFGNPSGKQKEIYNTVLTAQQKAVEFLSQKIKNGKKVKAGEVDKIARDYIISQNFPPIPHSLGHGIGLEVHELPHISQRSEQILKEGMVFSIEPGIYIESFGGVRIEDLFVIEKNKIRQLTTSSKNLITI